MNTKEARIRIKELTEEINRHNYLYYVLSNPAIEDYHFDLLLEELKKLEHEHPSFILPDSPTQRVGGEVTTGFIQVSHRYPMLSLSNTYSEGEIEEFDARVRKTLEEKPE